MDSYRDVDPYIPLFFHSTVGAPHGAVRGENIASLVEHAAVFLGHNLPLSNDLSSVDSSTGQ